MELRKLIKFGNSSFVVSLPRRWINKNNLGKGDLLYFNENGNSELVISPRENEKKKKEKRIVIDIKNKPASIVKRQIMSAYIGNYDMIKITGELKDVRSEIDNTLHGLLALEIMEESPDKIIVKDFLNVSDISINDVLRRMDIIVRSMLNDVDTSFDKNMYDKLIQVDKSVNKLMFLMYRVIRLGMKDPDVLKTLKVVNCAELLSYWLIVKNLEGIADDTKRIARFLNRSNISKTEKEDFKKLFQEIKSNYTKLMKAYYSDNKDIAHQMVVDIELQLIELDNIFNKCENRVCGPIIERFKAINGQLRELARVIVDKELGEEDAKKV